MPSISNPPWPPQTGEDRSLVKDSSGDKGPVLRDGIIEASVRNPKLLHDLLPHQMSAVEPRQATTNSSRAPGPGIAALPPTPEDGDTMRGQPLSPTRFWLSQNRFCLTYNGNGERIRNRRRPELTKEIVGVLCLHWPPQLLPVCTYMYA